MTHHRKAPQSAGARRCQCRVLCAAVSVYISFILIRFRQFYKKMMLIIMRSILLTFTSLLCLIVEAQGHYKQVNFTRRWAAAVDSLTHPTDIIKANDRLFAVTLSDAAVTITSIFDSSQSNRTCDFNALEPDETFTDIDFGVFALGNGKIVVRTRALMTNALNCKGPKSVGQDLFIIVDPFDCSSLRILRVPRKMYRVLLSSVPYRSTFDLIYRSRPSEDLPKAPQRYNERGKQVQLDYYLSQESEIPSKFRIATIKPYDSSAGYIVANYVNDELTLRHLDSQFNTLMQTPIEKYVESLSTAYGNVTYCQMTWSSNLDTNEDEKQQRCFCHFFDPKLNKKASVLVVEPNRVHQVIVVNLPDGGAVVAVVHEVEIEYDYYPGVLQYYLQRIDADGKAREPVMVAEKKIWHYKMKIFDMENGRICLYNGGETVPFRGPGTLKYGAWVDCVDVSDL